MLRPPRPPFVLSFPCAAEPTIATRRAEFDSLDGTDAMRNMIFPLQVHPRLPEAIERLEELASNFWFSWHPASRWLFSRLDQSLWRRTDNNPKLFLRCVAQAILDHAADDENFVGAYRKVMTEFDSYV